MTLTDRLDIIQDYMESGNILAIENLLQDLHSADIAEILIHLNKKDNRLQLFQLIPKDVWGDVITELEHPIVEEFLEFLNIDQKTDIINSLDSDDAVDVISLIEPEEQKQILENVDDEQEEEILELLKYQEETAGGLMRKEFVQVYEDDNVNQVIETIREYKDEVDHIYNIWVTDHRNNLLGLINLKDLLLSKPTVIVSDIMSEKYHYVDVHMEQEEVARMFEKYDLIEIPVVDDKHHLVGHITIDDIVDVLEEEAQEDISKLSGTRSEEIKEQSPFRIVQARIPWLIVALIAGLGAALIMDLYHDFIMEFVALSFFVPVVIGMGGNVGIQSSTIVIRGMALGEIDMFNLRHRLFKELVVALMNGIIVSSILFIIIFLLYETKLAMATSVAMIVAMLFAGIVGAMIPFMLKKFHLDPALSSGPFITTSNDIAGTFIYFMVAQFFLIV